MPFYSVLAPALWRASLDPLFPAAVAVAAAPAGRLEVALEGVGGLPRPFLACLSLFLVALALAVAVLPVAPLAAEAAPAVAAVVAGEVTLRAGMGHLSLGKVTGCALMRLLAPVAVSPVVVAGVAAVCIAASVAVVSAGVLLA